MSSLKHFCWLRPKVKVIRPPLWTPGTTAGAERASAIKDDATTSNLFEAILLIIREQNGKEESDI